MSPSISLSEKGLDLSAFVADVDNRAQVNLDELASMRWWDEEFVAARRGEVVSFIQSQMDAASPLVTAAEPENHTQVRGPDQLRSDRRTRKGLLRALLKDQTFTRRDKRGERPSPIPRGWAKENGESVKEGLTVQLDVIVKLSYEIVTQREKNGWMHAVAEFLQGLTLDQIVTPQWQYAHPNIRVEKLRLCGHFLIQSVTGETYHSYTYDEKSKASLKQTLRDEVSRLISKTPISASELSSSSFDHNWNVIKLHETIRQDPSASIHVPIYVSGNLDLDDDTQPADPLLDGRPLSSINPAYIYVFSLLNKKYGDVLG